jgi:hypothetical protein
MGWLELYDSERARQIERVRRFANALGVDPRFVDPRLVESLEAKPPAEGKGERQITEEEIADTAVRLGVKPEYFDVKLLKPGGAK